MRMSSTVIGALALVLAGAVASPAARAAIQREADDEQGIRTFGGDANNLPVRPGLRWEDAVAWARTMPAVRLAMQTCAARGYLPVTAHDSAYVSIDPPATAVILPYHRPGLALPDCQSGQPLIMVVTRVLRDGEPSTQVTAGVVIVDARGGAMFTADSLTSYAQSDASFDVVSAGGEGGPGDRRYNVVSAWPEWFASPKSNFNKFIRCWGLGGITGCLLPLIHYTSTPLGMAIAVTQPEDLGFYMGFCMLGVALGCTSVIE